MLLHVHAAKTFRQACARRLRAHEFVGVLRAIAHGQRRLHIKIARAHDALDEIVDVDGRQGIACTLRLAHVALDHAGIRASDLGDRFAGGEVRDLIEFETLVGLAPA